MIFVFHPALGWLALLGGGFLIFVSLLNQALTARRNARAGELGQAAARFSRQAESGAELIRAQGMGGAMAGRWMAMQDAAVGEAGRASDWTGAFGSFTRAFRLFLQSAMLAVGAWLVLQSQITAGAMIAASIIMGRALAPIDTGISGWPHAQRARQAWRDLTALLDGVERAPPRTALPAPAARLNVNGVTLTLGRGEKPILYKIGFDVAPGEALGVIGRSGSGKTTLARILAGLARPTLGEVRLDGATLSQYGSERLGRHIGYLPQDVCFFDGTVAENIAQMTENRDDARVVAAAGKARVHDIILKLPDGYDTRIGGPDKQLSGGQKQRLALARALYNDPVLLILDEPNSALDADGSEALNAAVSAMKAEGRAVLIMTHRPTAISSCDKLLVLEAGRAAGYGPRDEIIRSMMKNADGVSRVVERTAS